MATAPTTGPALESRFQEGIYHRQGEAPPSSYRLLLLNVKPATGISEVRTALARIWTMLRDLRDRNLATDVPPDPAGARPPDRAPQKDQKAPDERCKPCAAPELTCLLGFGASLFDRYPRMRKPDQLVRLDHQGPFRKIRWVAEADRQAGEADLALQFIAWTELAVNRAVAEVWMMIVEQFLPLEIVAVHGGFNREDRRSWIGFHDGISNIEADRRPGVLTATSWMEGGTYMAFFRLAIDLERWRRLPLRTQELLVGRDKLTGSPLEPAGPGLPILRKGSPIFGDRAFGREHISPAAPPMAASVLLASHMHRANPNRDPRDPKDPILEEDNRIFRQGYEFLEQLHGGRLRLGINFVSFQGRLSRIRNMLSKDGWLGDVNFGGCPFTEPHAPGPIVFVEMIAGGYYAVPPKGGDRDSFPGLSLF